MAKKEIESDPNFKEYPKWVKNAEGKDVIVKDAEEEAEVTGKSAKKPGWGNDKKEDDKK